MSLRVLVLTSFFLAVGAGRAATQQSADGLGPADRLAGLSTIWKEAAYNFPYFDRLRRLPRQGPLGWTT